MSSGSKLVLLERCGDVSEAAALRALLQAHGIPCVVQGEQHRSMLGILGAYIEPRVLVAEADLTLAREIIESVARGPGDAAEIPQLEGAVCPLHEGLTVETCARCGAFLCAQCAGDAAERFCDACDEKLQPSADRRKRRRRAGALILALLFGPPVVYAFAGAVAGFFQ